MSPNDDLVVRRITRCRIVFSDNDYTKDFDAAYVFRNSKKKIQVQFSHKGNVKVGHNGSRREISIGNFLTKTEKRRFDGLRNATLDITPTQHGFIINGDAEKDDARRKRRGIRRGNLKPRTKAPRIDRGPRIGVRLLPRKNLDKIFVQTSKLLPKGAKEALVELKGSELVIDFDHPHANVEVISDHAYSRVNVSPIVPDTIKVALRDYANTPLDLIYEHDGSKLIIKGFKEKPRIRTRALLEAA